MTPGHCTLQACLLLSQWLKPWVGPWMHLWSGRSGHRCSLSKWGSCTGQQATGTGGYIDYLTPCSCCKRGPQAVASNTVSCDGSRPTLFTTRQCQVFICSISLWCYRGVSQEKAASTAVAPEKM